MRPEFKRSEESIMERASSVLAHPIFKERLEQLEELEKDRIYCHHGMEHLLTVARLSYIFAIERMCRLEKDLIYATAFLHDIGRCTQYEEGTPHAEAGLVYAKQVLVECGFGPAETAMALEAISRHSGKKEPADTGILQTVPELRDEALLLRDPIIMELAEQLTDVLYDGDKLSRDCFNCKAEKQCAWDPDMKVMTISW